MVYPVTKDKKQDMLLHLINSKNIEQLIIFAKTKSGCDDLESFLRDEGVKTEAIHGDKSQFLRTKIMSRFKEGKVRALVATDIVARGLDISMLPCVINYDLPYAALDYVHRVGRTGRAGNKGIAISIVSKSDVRVLRQIEKAIEHKIPVEVLEGFECDIFKKSPSSGKNSKSSKNYKRNNSSNKTRKFKDGQKFAKSNGYSEKGSNSEAKSKFSKKPKSRKSSDFKEKQTEAFQSSGKKVISVNQKSQNLKSPRMSLRIKRLVLLIERKNAEKPKSKKLDSVFA